MDNNIVITEKNLSEGRKRIAEALANTKATSKEITLAQLLTEENFFRFKKGMNGDENFSVSVEVKTIFGSTEIRIKAAGEEYNPIPAVTEEEDVSEEEAFRLAILKYNRDKMRFIRKGTNNLVIVKVHGLNASKKQLIKTVLGLILGAVCGILLHLFVDAGTFAIINDEVLTPIRSLFLNALHMMMAPVTFFAIIAGVTNISDAALIGKLGGKMVVVGCFMQVFVVLGALAVGTLIFSGDLSYMQAGISAPNAENTTTAVSIKDMFFDIIPNNLVDPFKGGNILQVMFLAIFFGLVINSMGEKAKGVTEVIDFLFRFMIAVLKVIVKAIPFIVFISMTALFAKTGAEAITSFSGLFGGLFIGVCLTWTIGAITIFLFGKINPINFTKKYAALSPLVFSVSSSHARLPFVLKFCSEKLGIDGKLAAFSLPVGVQLNKAGSGVFFATITPMMMSVYNITITPELFLVLWLSVFVMAMAKPPIPCGGIICLAYIFAIMGLPHEAISVVLCVEPIAAMFNGVCNESSNITTTFILAKTNDMLDEKKYFAS